MTQLQISIDDIFAEKSKLVVDDSEDDTSLTILSPIPDLSIESDLRGINFPKLSELNLCNLNPTAGCYPAVKKHLLQLTWDNAIAGNELNSIFYETQSFGIELRFKYLEYLEYRVLNAEKFNTLVDKMSEKESSPLVEYIRHQLGEDANKNCTKKQEPIVPCPKPINWSDPVAGIKEIIAKCKELPKEWTVMQLCKRYNPKQNYSLKVEYYSCNRPLSLTMFCYQGSDEMDYNPINVQIEIQSNNLYEDFYGANTMIDIANSKKLMSTEVKYDLFRLLENLRTFLGPWIALFSGKIKGEAGTKWEQRLFEKVNLFCGSKYEKREIVLLKLVARRLDLCDNVAIGKMADYICWKKKKQIECFLKKLKVDLFKNINFEYYPCILIVDEILYHISWEMSNCGQEFSRTGSLWTVFDLHNKFKANIKDGYLIKSTKIGNVIINPDGTLKNMENRLMPFFTQCFPEWSCVQNRMISHDEFEELLIKSDVFCYAGHGDGLQYNDINLRKLLQLNLECVVFLYGCESMAYTSFGMDAEKLGATRFVDVSLCPATIGVVNVVTDLVTDIVSTTLLSSWIPAPKNCQWDPTKHKLWESGNKYSIKNILSPIQNPSLLANIARIKSDLSIPVWMRMTIVCRGLPILNRTD